MNRRVPKSAVETVGVIAQLGERFNGIEEVVGSIPSGSTTLRLRLRVAYATWGVSRAKATLGEGVPPEALAKGGWFHMYYVYLIQSETETNQRYIGYSTDLKQRLSEHNSGKSKHTSKYMPWKLVSYHAFADQRKAQEFEYYLKTGSGQAFAKKRFW